MQHVLLLLFFSFFRFLFVLLLILLLPPRPVLPDRPFLRRLRRSAGDPQHPASRRSDEHRRRYRAGARADLPRRQGRSRRGAQLPDHLHRRHADGAPARHDPRGGGGAHRRHPSDRGGRRRQHERDGDDGHGERSAGAQRDVGGAIQRHRLARVEDRGERLRRSATMAAG